MTTDEPTPEVLLLAKQLMGHPNAVKSMANTEARVRAQRETARLRTQHHCPYCGTAGVPINVPAKVEGLDDWAYSRRRDDCCQQAIFEAASIALNYSTDPKNPEDASLEQAQYFAVLKVQLTNVALRRELETLEYIRKS